MGSKSIFQNGLKHRTFNTSKSEDSTISIDSKSDKIAGPAFANSPTSTTLPHNYGRAWTTLKKDPRRMIKTLKPKHIFKLTFLLCKVFLALAILSIASCSLYIYGMSIHNGRSVRDPCMVANASKDTMHDSLLAMQRDLTIRNSPVIPTAFTSAKIEFEPKVPKLIHQQWKTEMVPKKFMKWKIKWLEYFPEPEYQHMLWTDEKGRALIVEHYPWFLSVYDGYEHNINRADAARYFILHYYGGIYADLDYEPTTNFYEYLPQNQVGMVESPYYWNEKTQNCLMSSPKNDPFWVDLFTVLTKNAKKEEVLEATGPILLDQAMAYSTHPSYILPCENFQRVPLGEYDQTLWTTVYDREIMFRLRPISKNCGYYSNDQCHFGKHHNTVSYRTVTGKVV
jgi:mannosyltransferase OCH1-like enzyme